MKCVKHSNKEAKGACVGCGNLYCADCLVKVKNKNYCKDCIKALLGDTSKSKSEPAIVPIQQQQQQQQESTDEETSSEKSSSGWDSTKPVPYATPIKWIAAILTILMALGVLVAGRYLGGLVLFLVGLYWVPPIMDLTQKFLKEKYNVTAPRWLRILASIIVFFAAIMVGR